MGVKDWETFIRFVEGDFSKNELEKIGVEKLYKIARIFWARQDRANDERAEFENAIFNIEDDLGLLMEARRFGINVCIESESMDELRELRKAVIEKAETKREEPEYNTNGYHLPFYWEELREAVKAFKREHPTRTDGVYLKVKRIKRIADKSTNDILNIILSKGEKSADEVRREQRTDAAEYIKAENKAGRKTTIYKCALHFKKQIEAEKECARKSGVVYVGYENCKSLQRALNKFADELGIAQYKDEKRKRKAKAEKPNAKRGEIVRPVACCRRSGRERPVSDRGTQTNGRPSGEIVRRLPEIHAKQKTQQR